MVKKQLANKYISPDKFSTVIKIADFVPFLIVLIQILGIFLPENTAWGFNFWRYIPTPYNLIILAVVFVFLLPPVIRRTDHISLAIQRGGSKIGELFENKSYLSYPLIAIFTFVILFIFRSRAYIYGDGFTWILTSTKTLSDLTHWSLYLQSGSILLNKTATTVFGSLLNLTPAMSIAVVNSLGGVIGLWALYKIPKLLSEDKGARALIFLGSLTSGAVILFFGYIENYTWATCMGLWSLFWMLKYVEHDRSPVFAFLFALAAIFFHAMMLPFLMVAVLSILLKRLKPGKQTYLKFTLWVCLIALAGSIIISFINQQTETVQLFTPLTAIISNPYSALSAAHLKDIMNILLLNSPLGLLLLLIMIPALYRLIRQNSRAATLLVILSFYTFLAVFWIDPEVGAPRDWDLLSQFGFPLTITGLYFFSRLFSSDRPIPGHWCISVSLVVFITLVPNLYEKNQPAIAEERLDNLLYNDIHYQSGYKLAERCLPWAQIVFKNTEDESKAIKFYRRYVETNLPYYSGMGELRENYLNIWIKLGEYYFQRGDINGTRYSFQRAIELEPENYKNIVRFSYIEKVYGDYSSALKYLEQAHRLQPYSTQVDYYQGKIFIDLKKYNEAVQHLRKALAPVPNSLEINLDLAKSFTGLKDYDSAYVYYKKCEALNRGVLPDQEAYRALFISSLDLKKLDEARSIYNYLERSHVPKPVLDSLKQMFMDAQE